MTLHMNLGPGPVKEVKRWSLGERWCFHCRRRTEFRQRTLRYDCDPLEDFYGPWGTIECERCEEDDADLFPGRFRIWGCE
jgi:hypothetical protein